MARLIPESGASTITPRSRPTDCVRLHASTIQFRNRRTWTCPGAARAVRRYLLTAPAGALASGDDRRNRRERFRDRTNVEVDRSRGAVHATPHGAGKSRAHAARSRIAHGHAARASRVHHLVSDTEEADLEVRQLDAADYR